MKELINKIRIKINDSAAYEFSDNEIITYIHDGLTSLENILLLNRVKFNISLLHSSSSLCPEPKDMLEIYKVVSDSKEIPLKDISSSGYGYYILNNNIILPCSTAEIYYIKEFQRSGINDEINLPYSYTQYLYLYAYTKALSRLEFNMESEENQLINMANIIVKNSLHKDGSNFLKRYNGYTL